MSSKSQYWKMRETMEREDEEARLRKQWDKQRESLRVRAKDSARSIRSDFLVKTDCAALFKDPVAETTELTRLEEVLLEHLVAQMEVGDAKLLEDATTSKDPEHVDKGNERVKPAESPSDSAMVLSSDEQGDEHSVPAILQLRGGDENDHDAEHDQRPQATPKASEEAQQEAAALAAAAADEEEEEERRKKLRADYNQTTHRVKVCDMERKARVRRLQRLILRERAGRTSGLASDETFEHMRASAEAEDCEWVEAMKQQRLEAFSSDAYSADGAEEAMLEMSVEEELRRRKPQPEAESAPTCSPKRALQGPHLSTPNQSSCSKT